MTETYNHGGASTDEALIGADPVLDAEALDAGIGDPVRAWLNKAGRRPLLTAEEEIGLAQSIEAGLYAEYKLAVAEQQNAPLDLQLARDYRQVARAGRRDKEHLCEANLLWVVTLAKRYTGRGLDHLELIQEGNIGLVQAIEKFDYTKGVRLTSFSKQFITGAMTRALANTANTIRLPVERVNDVNKVRQTWTVLAQSLSRPVEVLDVAAALGVSKEWVIEMLDYAQPPMSFDEVIGDSADGSPMLLGDVIPDTTGIEERVIQKRNALLRAECRLAINDALTPREATVIRQSFGLDGMPPMRHEDIATGIEVGRSTVTMAQKRALGKLAQTSLADLYRQVRA